MVPEADVAEEFNLRLDEAGTPQRALSDFVVTRDGEHVSVCELDDKNAVGGVMRAVGTLHSSLGSDTLRTETGDLLEMCIEYSLTDPILWVRSGGAWYELRAPAREYARKHDLALGRFEMCARIYIIINTLAEGQKTFEHIKGYLSQGWNGMAGYTEKQILQERLFILDQLRDLDEPLIRDSVFLKVLSEKKESGGGPSDGKPPASSKSGKKKKKSGSSSGGASSAASPKPSGPWVPRLEELDLIAQEQLLARLGRALRAAMKMKNAGPFLRPVDPEGDGCLDYLSRVKKPMDYGTIWDNLEHGRYGHDVMELLGDVRLIRKNCMDYNGPEHQFVKFAGDVEKKFEREARSCEDAELKAMQKRLNPPSNAAADKKKKAAAASADGDGVAGAGPSGRKPPASGKSKSKKAGASSGSSGVDGCISSASGSLCGKPVLPASRYCSDDCGMAVARKKLKDLLADGIDVASYIPNCIGKSLVHKNSLNV